MADLKPVGLGFLYDYLGAGESDLAAIRTASENRHGKHEVPLPSKKQWERRADPKQVLFWALRQASGKSTRAWRNFDLQSARLDVSFHTGDFSALRGLKSFDAFEAQLIDKLRNI